MTPEEQLVQWRALPLNWKEKIMKIIPHTKKYAPFNRLGEIKTMTLEKDEFTTFKGIPIFPSLFFLEIKDCPITNWEGLKRDWIPRLKYLHLTNCPITSWEGMPAFLRLERIYLRQVPIINWEGILKLPRLLSVGVSECSIEKNGVYLRSELVLKLEQRNGK